WRNLRRSHGRKSRRSQEQQRVATVGPMTATRAQTGDEQRRTLILTGASRGIGHATVKRFASAGWRVITCSRHAFPENCPWAAGPEDHIQVDLADPNDTLRAVRDMRERLADGKLHALVNNAAI